MFGIYVASSWRNKYYLKMQELELRYKLFDKEGGFGSETPIR